MADDGHNVLQAQCDADTNIVKAAIHGAQLGQVATVVADDTDVLVLLVHHFQSHWADIYMLSLSKKVVG